MTGGMKNRGVACVHVLCINNILVKLADHVFGDFVLKREQVIAPSLGYILLS